MTFIRSSFCSTDGCVECDLDGVTGWAKATRSVGNGNCAEAVVYRAASEAGNCAEAGCTHGTAFRKAARSFSNGNCAEVGCAHGTAFRKAQASGPTGGNCAEAGCTEGEQFTRAEASTVSGQCPEAGGKVLLRDSKGQQLPEGERYRAVHLHYDPQEWDDGRGVQFTPVNRRKVDDEVKAVRESRNGDPDAQWYMVTDGTDNLYFDQGEVDAFLDGVRNGEFELA